VLVVARGVYVGAARVGSRISKSNVVEGLGERPPMEASGGMLSLEK